MATSTYRGDDGQVLRVERETIEIPPTLGPTVDPDWSGRCENGHPVATASLRVVSEEGWDEDGEEYGFSYYACAVCGVEVAPGTKPTNLCPTYVSGPVRYYLNDEPISQEEAERLITSMRP